ncbi:CRISPR-associated endonuclease Cas6 [Arcicella aquatica]|uniref:CRISPR-associated endonuclease Cas6 n=1 Tax=Arcicella aquatica TaxID=217141 RepID=A0ABU5QU34_9BACT|nr:CRISPR-associated endonuclease Cas6 [Arcicella aquatica]MEA5260324.1 CRISPR-associated endonuclease Cas6 [Arcicella aquatica]
MTLIRSMLVVFPQIKVGEDILKFRSFINHQLNRENDLFHNHAEQKNSVIYRYPRIHYRNINGVAAIFGIKEGYTALNELLSEKLDKFPPKFQQFVRNENRTSLALIDTIQTYQLNHWLALNLTKNKDGSTLNREEIFEELNTIDKKKEMLRSILVAQLLGFCREMSVELPQGGISVEILTFNSTGKHKIVSETGTAFFTGFKTTYRSNLLLPDYVAFGKAVSKGYGWQTLIK